MKVVVYMRMARDEGAEQGLADQERMLRVFAKQNQMEVTGVFQDVGSGLDFDRPGWKKMLLELDKGCYGGVLTRDLSRIGRGLESTQKAIGEIESKGARVICMNGDHLSVKPTRQTMQELVRQFGKRQKRH